LSKIIRLTRLIIINRKKNKINPKIPINVKYILNGILYKNFYLIPIFRKGFLNLFHEEKINVIKIVKIIIRGEIKYNEKKI